MKCNGLKLATLGLSVMLAAFLLPTPFGYADDSSNEIQDPPQDALVEPVMPSEPEQNAEQPSGGENASDTIEGAEETAPNSGDPSLEPRAPLSEEAKSEASALATVDEDPIRSFSGATMFETAAAEALAAYPEGSESVIIVGSGDAWVDALSATGLAASKGPILFTERDSLHPATASALKDLGAKSVVIIGGNAAVSSMAERAIESAGVKVETRLGGADCYDTQMKIYEYGRANGLWNASIAIIATGSHFGDALSISPVAFARKIPIFLVEAGGVMRNDQKQALVSGARNGGFTSVVVVGGPSAVSTQVEGFASGVTYLNNGLYTRLGGATQYETSAEVAKWAESSQGFSWDNLAFSTGMAPYDALAGSVLQGRSDSMLLLIDGKNTATLAEAAKRAPSIGYVRFFGGTAAVTQSLRDEIVLTLGISTDARLQETSKPEKLSNAAAEEGGELLNDGDDLENEADANASTSLGLASEGGLGERQASGDSNASIASEGEIVR